MDYQDINAATITRWIEDGWEWGKPIDHNTYAKALAGEWDILLTPTRPVPHSWFPEDLRGLRVLGLASGGGQQMPILTARGARCTVLDYTPAPARRRPDGRRTRRLRHRPRRADMSKPLPFAGRLIRPDEDTNGYGRLHELGIPQLLGPRSAQKPED